MDTHTIKSDKSDKSDKSNTVNAALDKGAESLDEHWNERNWNAIERQVSPFDRHVIDEINNFGQSLFGIINVLNTHKESTKCMSDEFFNMVHEKLLTKKLISNLKEQIKLNINSNDDSDDDHDSDDNSDDDLNEDNQKDKKDKKQLQVKSKKDKKEKKDKRPVIKKADLIRNQNAIRMINDSLDIIERSYDNQDFKLPLAFNDKILEIRGLGYIQCARFLFDNKKKYFTKQNTLKKSKISFVYGIIVAFHKFIQSVTNIESESIINSANSAKFSIKCVEILQEYLNKLKHDFQFDGMTLYNYSPHLLTYTDFDFAIPKKSFKPYPQQIELMDKLYQCIKNESPFVCTLRTTTGTGKTTVSVGCATIISKFRILEKKHNKLLLIFCCNIRSVMNQTAQLLYNSNIPFAMAYVDDYKGLRVINNKNCKSDDKRVAIVCGPDACYELLVNKKNNYVLFLDEPTIGADVKSKAAKMNVKILNHLPKYSILSSATLPVECYSWIHENHEIKYGSSVECVFHDIYSNKIHIACEVKTFKGELVIPSLGCINAIELQNTITNIINNPILGRVFTPNVVKNMVEVMKLNNIKNLPDVNTLFSEFDNLNCDAVRNLAMDLLNVLVKCPDSIIERVCHTKINVRDFNVIDESEKPKKEEDDDIVWEKEEEYKLTNIVEFTKLATHDAHKYLRQNLIATTNPLEFTMTNFKNYLDEIIEEIGSLKKLENVYYQELAIWQKQCERLEKQGLGSTKKQETKEKSAELEKLHLEDDLNSNKPILRFPMKYQINTLEHAMNYAKTSKLALDRSALRTDLNVTNLGIDTMRINDDLKLLLAAGIGIYDPSCKDLSSDYLSLVLILAEEGKLAYLIANSSISYGTNYPINRVFITKDFSDVHSVNTIYQLMSRAGRVGKSWIAETFIDDTCASKLINLTHIKDINEYDIETININELHDEIVEEEYLMDQIVIKKIEEQKRLEREHKERCEKERLEKERIERERIERERLEQERLERERIEKEKEKAAQMNAFKNKMLSGFNRTSTNNGGRRR
jgi:hypothetical protein